MDRVTISAPQSSNWVRGKCAFLVMHALYPKYTGIAVPGAQGPGGVATADAKSGNDAEIFLGLGFATVQLFTHPFR